jgi:hypothetical protein
MMPDCVGAGGDAVAEHTDAVDEAIMLVDVADAVELDTDEVGAELLDRVLVVDRLLDGEADDVESGALEVDELDDSERADWLLSDVVSLLVKLLVVAREVEELVDVVETLDGLVKLEKLYAAEVLESVTVVVYMTTSVLVCVTTIVRTAVALPVPTVYVSVVSWLEVYVERLAVACVMMLEYAVGAVVPKEPLALAYVDGSSVDEVLVVMHDTW